MELEKVIYQFGNNKVFDYFILDRKENAIEKDIDKNSLAYHFDGKEKIKVSNYGQIVFGAFDILLEKRKKGTDTFCGYSLASEDEIKITK
ncbi:hypothetical protein [Aequorivita nionensis]|uniref:hypothetical protein n=1 Tax=Aequorivita nionensis TaxID=1287690 RepID=UPI003965B85A